MCIFSAGRSLLRAGCKEALGPESSCYWLHGSIVLAAFASLLQVVPWVEQAAGGAIQPLLDTRVLAEMLRPLDLNTAAQAVSAAARAWMLVVFEGTWVASKPDDVKM